jgi:hypothetical protein
LLNVVVYIGINLYNIKKGTIDSHQRVLIYIYVLTLSQVIAEITHFRKCVKFPQLPQAFAEREYMVFFTLNYEILGKSKTLQNQIKLTLPNLNLMPPTKGAGFTASLTGGSTPRPPIPTPIITISATAWAFPEMTRQLQK